MKFYNSKCFPSSPFTLNLSFHCLLIVRINIKTLITNRIQCRLHKSNENKNESKRFSENVNHFQFQPSSGLFLWVMFQKVLCNIFNWVLWSFFGTFGKSLEKDWYNSLIEVCSQWHILNIVTLEARLLVLLFYKTSLSVSDNIE